jgi:hypothetical protein
VGKRVWLEPNVKFDSFSEGKYEKGTAWELLNMVIRLIGATMYGRGKAVSYSF